TPCARRHCSCQSCRSGLISSGRRTRSLPRQALPQPEFPSGAGRTFAQADHVLMPTLTPAVLDELLQQFFFRPKSPDQEVAWEFWIVVRLQFQVAPGRKPAYLSRELRIALKDLRVLVGDTELIRNEAGLAEGIAPARPELRPVGSPDSRFRLEPLFSEWF